MFLSLRACLGVLLVTLCSSALAQSFELTPSAPGARVFIIEPAHGAVVRSPVTVRFGVEGMSLSPAGKPDVPDSGHHHLLVDATLGVAALDRPIPATPQHLHFGKGQSETTLELPPGRHTLQLVFGDWRHIPHAPPLISRRITITVR